MARYDFLPPNNTKATGNLTYYTWIDGFSKEELERIEKYCDTLILEKASLFGTKKEDDYKHIRITKTAWIDLNEETEWFYDRMANIVQEINMRSWNFDLTGFVEHFQYTVYQESDHGHYNWHVDAGKETKTPRKLSISLQLSDPTTYNGCTLEFKTQSIEEAAPKDKGTVIAFPSYTLHRVTPIKKGIRKAIVIWVGGPNFR